MFALSGTIPTNSDTWLIEWCILTYHKLQGEENLLDLIEKESHLRVVLGDDARYTMKGSGATSPQLDSSHTLHLSCVVCTWDEK